MTFFSHPIVLSVAYRRPLAIAALLGATMLSGPLTAARADAVGHATFQLAQVSTPSWG